MALIPQATYAFTDATGLRTYTQTEELVDLGEWSGTIAYVAQNAVQVSNANYVALSSGTNHQPAGIVDDYWSPLVQVAGLTLSSEEDQNDAIALALAAATAAQATATVALVTAWAGTAAAADASILHGSGSPEGVVIAVVGRVYFDDDTVPPSLYYKDTGTYNVGWTPLVQGE